MPIGHSTFSSNEPQLCVQWHNIDSLVIWHPIYKFISLCPMHFVDRNQPHHLVSRLYMERVFGRHGPSWHTCLPNRPTLSGYWHHPYISKTYMWRPWRDALSSHHASCQVVANLTKYSTMKWTEQMTPPAPDCMMFFLFIHIDMLICWWFVVDYGSPLMLRTGWLVCLSRNTNYEHYSE